MNSKIFKMLYQKKSWIRIFLQIIFLVRPKIIAHQRNSRYEAEDQNTIKYLIIIGARCNRYLFILYEIPLLGQPLLFSDCKVRFLGGKNPYTILPLPLKKRFFQTFHCLFVLHALYNRIFSANLAIFPILSNSRLFMNKIQ